MARIRSIKPDFWEDEKVGTLTPLARLLFIGTWNLADDEGLLRWTDDYLNASLFMYDSLSLRRVHTLMDELTSLGMIFPYVAGKSRQQLAYVVRFRTHQRINRPQPGKFPPPSLQSPAVLHMYGDRDAWTCHLCLGPINEQTVSQPDDPWAPDAYEDGSADLNLSPDHLVPRAAGGNDYPSNIRAAHIACNKARGDHPVDDFITPESVRSALSRSRTNSLNGSVNDTRNQAPTDHGAFTPSRARAGSGKGREQGGEQGTVLAEVDTKTKPAVTRARPEPPPARAVADDEPPF